MKNRNTLSASNVLLALVLTVFIISLAVVVTLNFRQLYYFDIEALNIPATSGYTSDVIKANYDVLIDYNFLLYRGELNFPSLEMSEAGRIHFREVKVIFDAVQIIFIASGVLAIAGSVIKLKRRNYGYLKLAGIFTIALPVLLGGIIAVNWSFFFVKFHELFFNNDYWIFSSETDPVIKILPDTFFMHAAIMILALVVFCAVISLVCYKILTRKGARLKHGE